MSPLLPWFIAVPVFGLLAGLLAPRKKEALLSWIAIGTLGVQLAGMLVFLLWWLTKGAPTLELKYLVLYKSHEFEFFIDFYLDAITAVFALVGSVLTFVVAIFSRYYMHREQGFKRFFNTLLLFFTGYNLIVFSGNFETLFIGWEILGITSFLLIAFYRDRYLPVKNGFKVLSFYRLGDICLILAMWMSHHLWHKNTTFAEMGHAATAIGFFQEHYFQAAFISGMILIAAAIKSAQLPFSTWLPRAMEGPTTSTAIFYGSLSVHIGAFLLLRTYGFWSNEVIITALVIAMGLATSLVANSIARVQSSVKTQIAYASITQIGLIMVEIGLGLHGLALFHFAANAFLRTYQLLVSPSVLSYLVHDMFFNFSPRKNRESGVLVTRIQHAFYILSIKEWNFDYLMFRYLWRPFKWMGHRIGAIHRHVALWSWGTLLLTGMVCLYFKASIDLEMAPFFPPVYAGLALLLILQAFNERNEALHAWVAAVFSQLFLALSIFWNKGIDWSQSGFYWGGSLLAALVGFACLYRMKSMEGDTQLNRYHGHSYEHPRLAFVFLMAALGLAGFPITPTFIGIDLMFTHINADQIVLVVLTALNFLFLELTILRIYTRIFLGQHIKTYHPIAFKSS